MKEEEPDKLSPPKKQPNPLFTGLLSTDIYFLERENQFSNLGKARNTLRMQNRVKSFVNSVF